MHLGSVPCDYARVRRPRRASVRRSRREVCCIGSSI